MPDQARYEAILDQFQGQRNHFIECDGDTLRALAAQGMLKPNDQVRPKHSRFFFYAHQINLFALEELEGVPLKEDNLPPKLRGKWRPEPAPYLLLQDE